MPTHKLAALTAAFLGAIVIGAGLPAQAQPEAGLPAPPLSGFDLVSQAPLTLDDFRGRWVLLDFWATWCGPCIEKLPELISSSAPYRADGRLALVSLSADRPETLPTLRALIEEQKLDFPILLPASAMDSEQLMHWDVSTIPSTYLINPEGLVVARDAHFERIDSLLGFYLEQDRPLLRLDSRHTLLPDGSVEVVAEVSSQGKALPAGDLKLSFNLAWDEWIYDTAGADPTMVVDSFQHIEPDFALGTLKLGPAGNGSYTFTIPANPKMGAFFYGLALDIPGSEGRGADGAAPLRQWYDSEYVTLVEPSWAPDETDEYDVPLPPGSDPALAEAEDLTDDRPTEPADRPESRPAP